ncbi:MBL fold metallo-hydrolase [Streptomyces sp. NEAU-S77]|uniref:MBL fold metallo-hydrolase n=1 Tax=Streptomyces sp. NEAU-S77 TaxID=3411033 RepID=UPI003BA2002A
MEVIEVLPSLRMLRFPVGAAYLWRDGDELTLIDTGTADCAAEVEAAHTNGSIALHLPGPRVLFTGDAVANVGRIMLGVFNTDGAHAIESPSALGTFSSPLRFESLG